MLSKFIEQKASSKAVPKRESGRRKPDGRVLSLLPGGEVAEPKAKRMRGVLFYTKF